MLAIDRTHKVGYRHAPPCHGRATLGLWNVIGGWPEVWRAVMNDPTASSHLDANQSKRSSRSAGSTSAAVLSRVTRCSARATSGTDPYDTWSSSTPPNTWKSPTHCDASTTSCGLSGVTDATISSFRTLDSMRGES